MVNEHNNEPIVHRDRTVEVEETEDNHEKVQALKITYKGGKSKTVIMKGAFSELLGRALNALYGRNTSFDGSYSLESEAASPEVEHNVHVMVKPTAADIQGLLDFLIVYLAVGGERTVLVGTDESTSSELVKAIEAMCKNYLTKFEQAPVSEVMNRVFG